MQGWMDSPLSEKGERNALALGKSLSEIEFHRVYTSPAGRTRKTAELIRGTRNIEIIEEENLREIGLGSWEGMYHKDIEALYPEDFDKFWRAPHLYYKEDGETFKQLQDRTVSFINRIIEEHRDTENNILIVTHAAALKSIMSYFENREIKNIWDPPFAHDSCLCTVEVNGEGAKILMYGDISHLENEA